jgi:deazaflavin-dependent oxidoreductase (nitroreductase family)
MSETFLYLTTRGRTTGQPRQIEIWFVELDGRLYVVSERGEESGWVKNIRREPSVRVSVGTRADRGATMAERAGVARIPGADVDAALMARVRAAMDAKYSWSAGLVVEIA